MLKIFLDLFFIIPLTLLVVTIFLIRSSVKKLKEYQECTGTILRFYRMKRMPTAGAHHRARIAPVIAYKVRGKSYELIGNYYSSWMKVGQEIQIMYREEDPTQATVTKGLYMAPFILSCLTVGFAGAWSLLLIARRYGLLPM